MKKLLLSLYSFFVLVLQNQEGNFNLGGETDGGSGTSGDSNGTSGGGDSGGGSGGDDDSGAATIEYPEGLDQEYHGNKTLLKYLDTTTGKFKNNEVFKALIHASSQIGADKMLVPNEKFTTDQWKETYKKLGVPETIEKYDIKNNLADGQKDSGLLDGFKKVAHDNGILPRQAQALFDYMNTSNHTSAEEQTNAALADRNTQIEGLKTKWGEKYEHNVQLAGRGLEQFASKEEIDSLTDQGFMESVLLTDIFQRIGSGLLEDKFDPQVKGTSGSTPEEIQDKINSFYDEKHPFRISGHPQQNFYRKEMERMLEQLHGKTVISAR